MSRFDPRKLARTTERGRLVAALLEQESTNQAPGAAAITPAPAAPDYPLSFAQQRLWFLAQLDPTSPAYNVPAIVRLRGPLDRAALAAALRGLIAHHAALRTIFPLVDGQPRQVITSWQLDDLPLVDLTHLPVSAREAAAARTWQTLSWQPFDLLRGPLLRSALLRLAADDHIWVLVLHHSITDGWSMGLLSRDLITLYNATVAGTLQHLPALGLQYTDFSVWQRHWLAGPVLETQLAYWKRQLGGPLPILQLPTDHPRPPVQTYRGSAYSWELPLALSRAIRALAQQEGVTPFMTLLAVFQAWLARYTGISDILVGSPLAGRNRAALEGIVGCFINTLVFRTNLADNPPFLRLLGRVRETALDAYAHQDLPFERLVEEIQPVRHLSHSALFQIFFALQNVPEVGAHELAGLEMRPVALAEVPAKFDLNLSFDETPETFLASVVYNADLFEEATVRRMATHFETLLAALIADPTRRIGDVPLLSPAEARHLQQPVPAPRATLPPATTVHALFEAQVARTPNAPALAYEGRQLTYQELNGCANQLAHYLRAAGVGPDCPVGLHLERGPDLIVGLLGILKAGGAYLPLDSEAPPERVTAILRDAAAPILLTQAALAGPTPPAGVQVVYLDADAAALAAHPAADPSPSAGPGNLLYVIYTSGSTGTPKGVAVEHRQLLNYLAGILPVLDLPPNAHCASVSTLAADLGNTMIFPALCSGGCLHLIARERLTDPAAFADYGRSTTLDYLKIVPSHLAALLGGADPAAILPRRGLVIGGESAGGALIAQVAALAPGCRIINHYGPTETTVGVLTYPVEAPDAVGAAGIPLGRPLSGSAVYIWDRYGQIAPPGVPGEIVIGGAGVARGYLGRPDLTAARFVPDPYSPTPGARLYRTGDQGRCRPDGTIEFRGRRDLQVKIHGFRVELGEIRAVLSRHPAVRECAVLARPMSGSDSPQVAAYIIGQDPDAPPAAAELRAHVAARLPAYMVPAHFIVLPALPLTANGKLDSAALPAPAPTRLSSTAYQPPRTEREMQLVSIWQKVLGVTPIGIHDNYFALGGDSIRVIQILIEAQQYGLPLTTKALLQHQTIYELAASQAVTEGVAHRRPPLELLALPPTVQEALPSELEVADVYPTAHMQDLMLDYYQADADHSGAYHVQQRFTLEDPDLSVDALQEALRLLGMQNPILRTGFWIAPGFGRVQVVRRHAEIPLLVEDIQSLASDEQDRYIASAIRADRATPFAVNDPRAPMVRFYLFRRGPAVSDLLMAIHHANSDGWGNTHFLTTLFGLYETLKTGTAVILPPKPNSYKEFIALERAIGADPAARSFWRQQLAAVPPDATVPIRGAAVSGPDALPGEATIDPSGQILWPLDGALCTGLAATARRQHVSLKSLFLSAYLDLLGQMADRPTATAGIVTNGRATDLSDPLEALGLFWNLVPFGHAAGGADPLQQVRAVQQQLVAIEPYVRYPLAQIQADWGQPALFFATFNFLHFHNARAAPAGQVAVQSIWGYDRLEFPWNLVVGLDPFGTGAVLRVEYDPASFPASTAVAWVAGYVRLLQALAAPTG